jgi:glycerol-3-phosphate acyltransferase PlsY
LIGYLLGALPFAQWVSRYIKGVDIFSTGTTLAGTANVFWNVGRRSALLVFAGDVGKGSAAVAVAWGLGIEAPLTLVAAAAAIVGHWVSVFSSFRGGDAMTPLIGVSVALVPVLTVAAAVVGVATVLLMRNHYLRSSWGICTGFMLMLGLSLAFRVQVEVVTGLTVLAVLVLLRSVIVRRRISGSEHQGIIDELDHDPDLPPGMSESS